MVIHRRKYGPKIPLRAVTRDHYIPHSQGGRNFKNLVASCHLCNQLRCDMEAVAFRNLIAKWFKRNPQLQMHWHKLSKKRISDLRAECLETHERQLRGMGKTSIESAFLHQKLMRTDGHQLRA